MEKKVKTAFISVYFKEEILKELVAELHASGVVIYSTGGTADFISKQNIPVVPVEKITGFPSILGGRVKTLHPGVFGGILSRRDEEDSKVLERYSFPEIDMVIVDLYPFEEAVAEKKDHQDIIEKIDIGGVSLLRAAAKNCEHVVTISGSSQYEELLQYLKDNGAVFTLEQRQDLARQAFKTTNGYDLAIALYFEDLVPA